MSTRFSCFKSAVGILKINIAYYQNDLFYQVLTCSLQFPVRSVFPGWSLSLLHGLKNFQPQHEFDRRDTKQVKRRGPQAKEVARN